MYHFEVENFITFTEIETLVEDSKKEADDPVMLDCDLNANKENDPSENEDKSNEQQEAQSTDVSFKT